MLLNTEERPVEKCIPEATTAFTIKHSRKAFEILSDKLYTDKHGAIVRELAQNAYDSHKDAGRPEVPIEIDLPVKLDPVFRVRDYGTGLEHEQVLHLYTTYFESNKSHTNEFVGGLGLGSKSPFSYVDQFTVESWTKHGDKNTYCAFISEDGTPTITRLKCEPYDTKERLTGITITIAVKQEDFRLFQQAAARMLKFFPTYPKVLGGNDSSIKPIEYSMEGEFIGIRKDGNFQRYTHAKSYVLMGPVAYEIDLDQLAEGDKEKYNPLFKLPCVFFSSVGKLDIHVSRERLSYDPKTKAELSCILKGATAEMQVLVKEYIAAGTDKFDKFIRFNETYSTNGTWTRKLKRGPSIICKVDALTMTVNADRWGYRDPLGSNNWGMGFTYHPLRWSSQRINLLHVDVKHHVKWIKHNHHELVGKNWVLFKGSEEDLGAFEKRFGVTALKLSSLEEPPVAARRAAVQSGELHLYSYKPGNSYDVCRSIDISRKLFHSKHLQEEYAAYIPTSGQYPYFKGDYTAHRAKMLIETLSKDFVLNGKDVLGIPTSYTNVQKDSNLPLFEAVLDDKIQTWEDLQDAKAFSTMYLFKEEKDERIDFIRDIFDRGWIEEYIQAHPKSALTQLYHYSCYELQAKHYQFKRIDEMLSDGFKKKIRGALAQRAYAKKAGRINRLLDTIYKKHPYLVATNESGYRICNQSNLRYWDTMKHYFELAERKR